MWGGRERVGLLEGLAKFIGGRGGERRLTTRIEGLDEGCRDAVHGGAPFLGGFAAEFFLPGDVDGFARLGGGPALGVLLHEADFFFAGEMGLLGEGEE